MNKTLKNTLISLGAILLIFIVIFFNFTKSGITMRNNFFHDLTKVNKNTSYEYRILVEGSCRAMISNYKSYELTYNQYKDSDNEQKQEWAEQAKMSANKIVFSYNEYILKNSYIWEDNIPDDINIELKIIE